MKKLMSVMVMVGMAGGTLGAQTGVNPCHPNKCRATAVASEPRQFATVAAVSSSTTGEASVAGPAEPAANTKAALMSEEVETAISVGTKAKGGQRGLVLRDSGQGFLRAMDAFSTGVNGYKSGASATTGYWLEAWTPLSWIEQMASNHAKQFKHLTAENITDEMQEDVFRVIVHPDTPTEVTARGNAGSSSVEHVVLRSENRETVIQPLSTEPFTEESANAMGGKVEHQGVLAKFRMSDLKEVRHGDGEFFITIVGTGNENKDFKVKSKHFKSLK